MRTAPRAPVWIPHGSPPHFPDPRDFDDHGLIAGGGDLDPERLVAAYGAGIFPWYNEPPILWWSPNPRAIITPDSLHLSRSMKRTLRKTSYTVTTGVALERVMEQCAKRREGTWLSDEMQDAYLRLGEMGMATSYEVWDKKQLVGGLYGVQIGGLYAAESKFHRRTDASKIALVCAVTDLFTRGVEVFDVQFVTEHLRTLGVHEVPREEYLQAVKRATLGRTAPRQPSENLLPEVLARLALA
jgi:leucyl/phenylalanyl-tRNA--protein transferase